MDQITVTPLAQLIPSRGWHFEDLRASSKHSLFWLTRGQGRLQVECRSRTWGANTMFYVPAGTPFALPMNRQVFGTLVQVNPVAVPKMHKEALVHRISDVAEQSRFISVLDPLQREYASNEPDKDEACIHHAGLVAVWLSRASSQVEPEAPYSRAELLVNRFLQYIEANHSQSPGVQDAAAELRVTTTHLTRCCRSVLGVSAIDAISNRINYSARRLLSEKNTAMKDVADLLGFRSAAYFTRAFTNKTGQTPSAFRKQFTARTG